MTVESPFRARRVMFLSSNGFWGGSEELWSRAALSLAERGHLVAVGLMRVDPDIERVRILRDLGSSIIDLRGSGWIPRKARSLIWRLVPSSRVIRWVLRRAINRFRPEIVVISQGINHDGTGLANICRSQAIPYALVSQKADDLYWPHDNILGMLRKVYADARAAFFVSVHNRRLTEEQLGQALPNGEVVRNPFSSAWQPAESWPDDSNGLRLACLARLDAREKGQDLLLRVMAMPKWRERPISIHFYGSGHNAEALGGMARMLSLTNVIFGGFADRPEQLWRDYHGLILASRCEGLPLSLVEAMLNARVAVVTDVGGNAELLSDGETGFIASAPTVAALDDALERAWARRSKWREIGSRAAARARAVIPPEPQTVFADRILALIGTSALNEVR